ncbi:MAG: thioesterase family protein [Hyphomicrobiales bacterium]|nr:thioesterase family protein [Hyphomicrobiales bacterium]
MPVEGLRPGQPLALLSSRVRPDQTNAQGHLRAAQYIAVFDDAIEVFFPLTGLADAQLRHGDASPFLMDMHTCYLAELRAGDEVSVVMQHLGHDARRARLILTMLGPAGTPAATTELLLINMGLSSRRPVAWSATQQALWSELAAAHASLAVPAQAGRAIGAIGG